MSDDPTREAWEQLIRAMRNRLSHTEERDSRQRYRHALNERVRAFEIVMRYQPDSKRPSSFLLPTRAVPPNAACFLRDLLLAKPYRQTISGDMEEEFGAQLTQYGITGARLWFWCETVRTIATRNPVCRAVLVSGLARLAGWIFRQIGG